MGTNLFFQLGRSLGHAAVPAIRMTKSAWRSLTSHESGSVSAQAEFGRAMAAELRLKVRISDDAAARTLVRDIVQKLSARLRNKLRTFQVDVLAGPAPAAVALPGGFIFVSSALLDFCDHSPDEVAFLIGHEMGHIVRGHALERVLSRIGAEGLSSVLSRGLLNPALREAGLKWLESPHSAEAELDADEFAVRVAWAAGYDSLAAIKFLDRISALRASGEDVGDYLGSHPKEAERIAHIKDVWRIMGSRERVQGESSPARAEQK